MTPGLIIFLAMNVVTIGFAIVYAASARFERCRDRWIDCLNTTFETMQHRRDIRRDRDDQRWMTSSEGAYNFDVIMSPMYNLPVRRRMFFGLKWKHLLTGKQRFLAGIEEPDYVPHATVFMCNRKPWKVWSHPGFFHDVRVTAVERFHNGAVYTYVRYRGVKDTGGNVTLLSKLLPTGMNPQRRKG